MTSTIFLPECTYRAVGCDFHGLYRFFEDEDWHFVYRDGEKAIYPTAGEATGAAKDAMRIALNPAITGHMTVPKSVIEATEGFFANKHETKAREHAARKRGVRDVVFVEVKRQKASRGR